MQQILSKRKLAKSSAKGEKPLPRWGQRLDGSKVVWSSVSVLLSVDPLHGFPSPPPKPSLLLDVSLISFFLVPTEGSASDSQKQDAWAPWGLQQGRRTIFSGKGGLSGGGFLNGRERERERGAKRDGASPSCWLCAISPFLFFKARCSYVQAWIPSPPFFFLALFSLSSCPSCACLTVY